VYRYSEKGNTWVNRDTGEEYELSHLKGFQTSFKVKLDGNNIENVDVRVEFSNHCYTEEQKEGGKEEVVCTEMTKYGLVERVFCPKRWEFSKRLPDIIRGLNYNPCLQGDSHKIVYRHEKSNNRRGNDGWYICIKLDYKSNRTPSPELWVRSTHFRYNRPIDSRGGLTWFCVLLAKYLKPRYSKPE
jgi:hypothetical protein